MSDQAKFDSHHQSAEMRLDDQKCDLSDDLQFNKTVDGDSREGEDIVGIP